MYRFQNIPVNSAKVVRVQKTHKNVHRKYCTFYTRDLQDKQTCRTAIYKTIPCK